MGAEREWARVQSQHEDISQRGSRCAGYGVLDMCWMWACKILGVEQQTVERMGEERQGKIWTDYGAGQGVGTRVF